MVKIIWELQGHYRRQQGDGQPLPVTTLGDLVQNLRAIATDQKTMALGRVHRHFGLGFLPQNTVVHVLRRGSAQSAFMADHLLRPTLGNVDPVGVAAFQYQFITRTLPENITLNLKAEDPQIPHNFQGQDTCEGVYQLEIVPPMAAHDQAQARLAKFLADQPTLVLSRAFHSQHHPHFSLGLNPDLTAWLTPEDLPPTLAIALEYLRRQSHDGPDSQGLELTPEVMALIQDYQRHYGQVTRASDRIPNLTPQRSQPQRQLCINKGGHREPLQDLIRQAQEYLVICSYRLEDEEIIDLIAEKSHHIPVWILTDFNDEVQDRVDASMADRIQGPEEYRNADFKKRRCLQRLSQANLGFRSGAFHLKTYISEKTAYFGSCNLTGGSLGRNSEAGILWSGTAEHQFLLDYFRALWHNKTTAQAIASPVGFRSKDLPPKSGSLPRHPQFLTYPAFQTDIARVFQQFPQENIRIYTRHFNPLRHHQTRLQRTKSQIFFGGHNQSALGAQKIPHLHGKVVLVGSKVAYVGSQDFAFGYHPLQDLTYKTTDPQEVLEITHAVQALH